MYYTIPGTSNNVTLVVNRTHYGVGDHFLYSTTDPLSYALYASIIFFVIVVCTTLVLCCRLQRQIKRYKRKYTIHNSISKDDDTRATALLSLDDPRMGEMLGKFQWEVQASEVLTYEDPYLRSLNTITTAEGDDEQTDIEAAPEAADPSTGPPVVDGFYSITATDNPVDDAYHEDMYLEFIPRETGSGCIIQGFGKYDNGNFRVTGCVSSTGAAYWYEESYGTTGPPQMILARGTFERNVDTGIVEFTGQWFSHGGRPMGVYKLFSHNVLYIMSTTATVHSVAESTSSLNNQSTDYDPSLADGTTMGNLSNAPTMDSHQSVYEIADDRPDAIGVGIPTTICRSVTLEDPDNISPLGKGKGISDQHGPATMETSSDKEPGDTNVDRSLVNP